MSDGPGANQPQQDAGIGQTVRMDGEQGGAPLPETVKMSPPEASGGKPKGRWWLTSPRTTYLQLPKKQQNAVLTMLVVGVVLMVVTIVLLRVVL